MKSLITVSIIFSLYFISCGADEENETTNETTTSQQSDATAASRLTILEIAANNDNFSTLANLVEEADLGETLSSEGPFTVFAPTDAAFAALDDATLNAVAADKELLQEVLLYHVVAAKVSSSVAVTLNEAEMANGGLVTLNLQDGSLYLNTSVKVIATDIEASNGVIHVIDGVLLP